MNLYRVAYVSRAVNVDPKVAFVVADDERQAADFINSIKDNESQGVSTLAKDVQFANAPKPAEEKSEPSASVVEEKPDGTSNI